MIREMGNGRNFCKVCPLLYPPLSWDILLESDTYTVLVLLDGAGGSSHNVIEISHTTCYVRTKSSGVEFTREQFKNFPPSSMRFARNPISTAQRVYESERDDGHFGVRSAQFFPRSIELCTVQVLPLASSLASYILVPTWAGVIPCISLIHLG